MSTHLKNGPKRGSLRHQIRGAAGQVAEHKQAVRLRRAALGKRLHAVVTSPDMLFFVAGTGFVIGELTHRAGTAEDSANPQKSGGRSMASRVKMVLLFALRMSTLARAASTAGVGPDEIQGIP